MPVHICFVHIVCADYIFDTLQLSLKYSLYFTRQQVPSCHAMPCTAMFSVPSITTGLVTVGSREPLHCPLCKPVQVPGRPLALPTVQACAWPTVHIVQACASLCIAHCAHCASSQGINIQTPSSFHTISSIRGFPFSKTVPDQANFMETYVAAVHPTPAISYVHHPSLPSLRATETHNLHDPHKRPVLLVTKRMPPKKEKKYCQKFS